MRLNFKESIGSQITIPDGYGEEIKSLLDMGSNPNDIIDFIQSHDPGASRSVLGGTEEYIAPQSVETGTTMEVIDDGNDIIGNN